jgi:hypothetical protein
MLDPVAIATVTLFTATTVPVPNAGPVAINVVPAKLFSAPDVVYIESPAVRIL